MLHRWSYRRGVYATMTATVVLAVSAHAIDRQIWTPQLSGASAPLTPADVAAALSGALFANLVHTPDPIAEARSPRNLKALRRLSATAVLAIGVVALGLSPHGWDWDTVRTYALFAAASAFLTRYAGVLASAAAFAAYVGACLFAGVPQDGEPHWWAIPMHTGASTASLTLTLILLAFTIYTTFRSPRLPADHRRHRG